ARLTHVLSDGFAELGQTGRRPVVGKTLVQGIGRRPDDVARRIEIGLADLEMNDVAAFCLQRARFHQYFESGLCAETRHTLGEAKFVGVFHRTKIMGAGNLSLNSVKRAWLSRSFYAASSRRGH